MVKKQKDEAEDKKTKKKKKKDGQKSRGQVVLPYMKGFSEAADRVLSQF